MVQSFRDLLVWQKATDLTETIYRLTRNFPREEIYGLSAQIRRAAISIPSNIAEGQGRSGQGVPAILGYCTRICMRSANTT
ncbi:MAG TPA: four helix bundle protein [Terracidiphilus sp.]